MARLFLAIYPPASIRDLISRYMGRLEIQSGSGRLVARDNLHITLHYLGEQSEQQQQRICEKMEQIRAHPFGLQFDLIGFWRRPKVIWLGCAQVGRELYGLQQQVCSLAAESTDNRVCSERYTPHITLARKIAHWSSEAIPTDPICFKVEHFSLFDSRSTTEGVQYHEIQRWELSGKEV